LLIFIGPEGGWTDDERRAFRENGLTPISLGRTILRTETAALVAAGIAASLTVT
jgi:16S rRNA (uracil1498-N3)-methyltransferase